MTNDKIYLDHAASTPTDPEVVSAMKPYFTEISGNPSSIHTSGQQAMKGISEAKDTVASIMDCKPNEIIFTSGATESDNIAIQGIAYANKSNGNHIITSPVEHPAVIEVYKHLSGKDFDATYLKVDKYGLVDHEQVMSSITDKTILISVMYVNNEIGAIEPVRDIGKKLKKLNEKRSKEGKHRIYFHIDAVQGAPYLDIRADYLKADTIALSGHKIYGPKGIGALYVREGTKIDPLFFGGHQQYKIRPGTENVPGIVGFAKALEITHKNQAKLNPKLEELRNYLVKELTSKIPNSYLNGPKDDDKRIPSCANITFTNVEGESILLALDMKGIAVSTGSACSSGSLEPSHVLAAMDLPPEKSHGSIRFSLGKENTKEQIDIVVKELTKIIEKFRKMSPLK